MFTRPVGRRPEGHGNWVSQCPFSPLFWEGSPSKIDSRELPTRLRSGPRPRSIVGPCVWGLTWLFEGPKFIELERAGIGKSEDFTRRSSNKMNTILASQFGLLPCVHSRCVFLCSIVFLYRNPGKNLVSAQKAVLSTQNAFSFLRAPSTQAKHFYPGPKLRNSRATALRHGEAAPISAPGGKVRRFEVLGA